MRKKIIGTLALVLISTSAFAIEQGIRGYSSGDIIAVKTDNQIASWCDFNKQIVVTQFNVLCVYNGNKDS